MKNMVEKIRNIAIVAHGGAGKTSMAEAMLFNAGVTKRLGRVDDGSSALDFMPEEIERKTSLTSHFFQIDWNKKRLSIIDTPGDQNFFSSAKTCMPAADTVLIVIDGVDKVNLRTEKASEFAAEYDQPVVMFVNKMDKERSDYEEVIENAKELLSPKPIKVQIPIGKEDGFKGIVDLVSGQAFIYENGKRVKSAIPADLQDQYETERAELIENVAEADDSLLERYLEGGELSPEEISIALRKGIAGRVFAPVLCGSATKNIGIDMLCDFAADYMPSPSERGAWKATNEKGEEITLNPDPDAPFAALVFHTIVDPYAGRLSIFRVVSGNMTPDGKFYNIKKDSKERFNQLLEISGKEQKQIQQAVPGSICAVAKLKDTATGDTVCDEDKKVRIKAPAPIKPILALAIGPKAKGDEDKLFSSLSKILEEDISLTITRNTETKQMLLAGMGSVHIDTVVNRLKSKYNVEVETSTPKVPYRETIKKKVRVQGKHKKQSGGHGQYGDCWIVMEPMPKGSGFEFVDAIVGGSIPRQFIPAVEKGVIEASDRGVLAGCKCVDFKVTVDDGSFHAVDSSEMAFKVAGSLAFKKAAQDAGPVLLEPVMEMSIITPDEFMGDIMGDLNSRRGRVLGMDSAARKQIIKAQVPLSEVLTYANQLQSMTGGRGTYEMKFTHYDEVPNDIAERILPALRKENNFGGAEA